MRMKIKDFKRLEESIQEQDFNKSFKNINKIMFFLSIFGHFASIFLAFFLLSKVIGGAISDNDLLVTISSIILLTGVELLKREIFDKFSLHQIKIGKILNRDVLPLFLFSLIIIFISFYASIKGAEEFSNRSKEIEKSISKNINTYSDSLSNLYKSEWERIESEISDKKIKIEEKDQEQTLLESGVVGNQQKARIKDLKSEKSELKNDIKLLEKKLSESKIRKDTEISEYRRKIGDDGKILKEENKENSFLFIIISTIIEITILGGVYFNKYYKWRSYGEFKRKLENDPNLQKWLNANEIINVIYSNNPKINEKIISSKSIQDLCKMNGIIILNKEMQDLLKVLNSLGIIKTSGSSKYICKSKEISQELIKKYFKID